MRNEMRVREKRKAIGEEEVEVEDEKEDSKRFGASRAPLCYANHFGSSGLLT